MAELKIKKRDEKSSGLNIRDYDIYLNDMKLEKLQGININMEIDEANVCVLEMILDNIKVDADFIKLLEMNI